MIKLILSDFWHVLLFPKDFSSRGKASSLIKQTFLHASTFFDEYALNEDLLIFFSDLKKKYHIQLGIFSSGTLFRAAELDALLFPLFDEGISSSDIKFQKNDPVAYTFLAKKFSLLPSEVVFIDDSPHNIAAAKEAHVQAFHYHDNESIQRVVSEMFTKVSS